jgi:hypothetical protein
MFVNIRHSTLSLTLPLQGGGNFLQYLFYCRVNTGLIPSPPLRERVASAWMHEVGQRMERLPRERGCDNHEH